MTMTMMRRTILVAWALALALVCDPAVALNRRETENDFPFLLGTGIYDMYVLCCSLGRTFLNLN
jgi:hypothetical protein